MAEIDFQTEQNASRAVPSPSFRPFPAPGVIAADDSSLQMKVEPKLDLSR